MATSGTYTFAPDFLDLYEEAAQRAGVDATGVKIPEIRRTANLLFADMANRGIHLFRVEEVTQSLAVGTDSYTLAGRVQDVLEAYRRDSTGRDIELTRIGRSEYGRLVDRASPGVPTQIYVDRQRDAPVVYLWPVPDQAGYTLVLNCIRRQQDIGAAGNNLDVPYRYLAAVTSGLAYFIGMKNPLQCDMARVAGLKALFEEDLGRAQDEDREKVPMRIRFGRRS
jgi:hypothetical protein